MKVPMAVLTGILILLYIADVQAQSRNDHLDLGYESLEIDFADHNLTADGFSIAFTKEYRDQFLLLAGFKRYEFDEYDLYRMQQDTYNLGVGLHKPFMESVDVYGQLLFSAMESTLQTGTVDDQGVEAMLGFRTLNFQRFEIDTSIRYVSYEDPISLTGPEISITGQARWYLSDRVSLGVGGNYGEYESSWFGNFRINFDLDDE